MQEAYPEHGITTVIVSSGGRPLLSLVWGFWPCLRGSSNSPVSALDDGSGCWFGRGFMQGLGERAFSPSSQARLLSRFSTYDVAWAAVSPALAFIVRHGGVDHVYAMLTYCSTAFSASLLTFQLFKLSQPMSPIFSAPDAVEVGKACFNFLAVAGAFR